MTLAELFAGQAVALPLGAGTLEISSLAVDSRAVQPGALFAALPGVNADGAAYAEPAVKAGAAAVLASRQLELGVPCVVSPDPRHAFALAAAKFHGEPSAQFKLLGVTGTNGKTTTTYLIEQLAAALGARAGVIGTVEARWPGVQRPSTHTTPESHELQAMLEEMARARVEIAAIEVSSHALAQSRVDGCRFAGAAFTNLTRDHLDYHRTLEAYYEAKARLFRELLNKRAPAVLNLDDARCLRLAEELVAADRRVIGFTVKGMPAPRGVTVLAAEHLRCTLSGLSFTLRLERAESRAGAPDVEPTRTPIQSPLLGAHNAENLLAAIGLLVGTGTPLPLVARVAEQAQGAPGRLERIADPKGRVVLVDYAHSDDALARALDALSAAAGAGPRLICVFGCGGDRDKGKRPMMGKAAGARAQLTIATSDNPRSEDPLAILSEVEQGLVSSGAQKVAPELAAELLLDHAARGRSGTRSYAIVADRRAAIRLAIAAARPGDAVLIAGKGHEATQTIGAQKRPFDDRVEAALAIAKINAGEAP